MSKSKKTMSCSLLESMPALLLLVALSACGNSADDDATKDGGGRDAGDSAEADAGLDAGNALFEARRCLSCGNCFECDNCYGICPDNAITKLGPGKRFEFKYDYCKGCAMCAAECPCGAIVMVPEET